MVLSLGAITAVKFAQRSASQPAMYRAKDLGNFWTARASIWTGLAGFTSLFYISKA